MKEKLLRLEEKREFRRTLKTLYEKKAKSICGIRDKMFIINIQSGKDKGLKRIKFFTGKNDDDTLDNFDLIRAYER